MPLSSSHRVAILCHQGLSGPTGKTGLSLLRYGPYPVVAVIDQEWVGQSLAQVTGILREVPIVASVKAALNYQPEVLVIGIAPSGGGLPDPWKAEIAEALEAGLSLVNGLHTPLRHDPLLQAQVQQQQWIWDVRQEPENLQIGQARAQSLACRRVLTVGTDMSVGKMSTSLELHRWCQHQGWRSKFLATGQTGLMLLQEGIALDAVRVDFAAGAVEAMVMQAGSDQDVIFVEGQGSLLHPGSTATLPLLRGTQPTHLVLVHRAGQTHIHHVPHISIPPLPQVIHLYEQVAGAAGAFAEVKVVGIALNTRHLPEVRAREALDQAAQETGLPCTDPIRFDLGVLGAAIMT
ncbi:MAG: DUF1611 domain-containing protein [Synechococcaceae cyanobacterium SM2_3_1]|nr:DUF1611 domain-containing protein [Synechococcaceae cyanobacterium SM2_3_1]